MAQNPGPGSQSGPAPTPTNDSFGEGYHALMWLRGMANLADNQMSGHSAVVQHPGLLPILDRPRAVVHPSGANTSGSNFQGFQSRNETSSLSSFTLPVRPLKSEAFETRPSNICSAASSSEVILLDSDDDGSCNPASSGSHTPVTNTNPPVSTPMPSPGINLPPILNTGCFVQPYQFPVLTGNVNLPVQPALSAPGSVASVQPITSFPVTLHSSPVVRNWSYQGFTAHNSIPANVGTVSTTQPPAQLTVSSIQGPQCFPYPQRVPYPQHVPCPQPVVGSNQRSLPVLSSCVQSSSQSPVTTTNITFVSQPVTTLSTSNASVSGASTVVGRSDAPNAGVLVPDYLEPGASIYIPPHLMTGDGSQKESSSNQSPTVPVTEKPTEQSNAIENTSSSRKENNDDDLIIIDDDDEEEETEKDKSPQETTQKSGQTQNDREQELLIMDTRSIDDEAHPSPNSGPQNSSNSTSSLMEKTAENTATSVHGSSSQFALPSMPNQPTIKEEFENEPLDIKPVILDGNMKQEESDDPETSRYILNVTPRDEPWEPSIDFDGENPENDTDQRQAFTGIDEDTLNGMLCAESRLARMRKLKSMKRTQNESRGRKRARSGSRDLPGDNNSETSSVRSDSGSRGNTKKPRGVARKRVSGARALGRELESLQKVFYSPTELSNATRSGTVRTSPDGRRTAKRVKSPSQNSPDLLKRGRGRPKKYPLASSATVKRSQDLPGMTHSLSNLSQCTGSSEPSDLTSIDRDACYGRGLVRRGRGWGLSGGSIRLTELRGAASRGRGRGTTPRTSTPRTSTHRTPQVAKKQTARRGRGIRNTGTARLETCITLSDEDSNSELPTDANKSDVLKKFQMDLNKFGTINLSLLKKPKPCEFANTKFCHFRYQHEDRVVETCCCTQPKVQLLPLHLELKKLIEYEEAQENAAKREHVKESNLSAADQIPHKSNQIPPRSDKIPFKSDKIPFKSEKNPPYLNQIPSDVPLIKKEEMEDEDEVYINDEDILEYSSGDGVELEWDIPSQVARNTVTPPQSNAAADVVEYDGYEHDTMPHEPGTLNQKSKRFGCGRCGESYKNDLSLMQHYRTVHQGYVQERCIFCNKVQIKVHQHITKMHKGRIWTCITCYKFFNTKNEQAMHNCKGSASPSKKTPECKPRGRPRKVPVIDQDKWKKRNQINEQRQKLVQRAKFGQKSAAAAAKPKSKQKRGWTNVEFQAIDERFGAYIKQCKFVPMANIRKAVEEDSRLKNRTVHAVRCCISIYRRNSKWKTKGETSWTNVELQAIDENFGAYIKQCKCVPMSDIRKAVEEDSRLNHRTVNAVRCCISSNRKNPKWKTEKGERTGRWTIDERKAVKKHFKLNIQQHRNVTYPEIRRAREDPLLKTRKMETIRAYVNSYIKKLNRMETKQLFNNH